MTSDTFVYDIFISYAREDYDWVYKSLYLPLTQCAMPNGKKPKIFLDQSEIGVKIGEDFLEALAKAILTSHRVILVYSNKYFEKTMTKWELTKALQADPTGLSGKIFPILLDHEAEAQIPITINHIHYLDIQKQADNWCQRLIANMALNLLSEKRTIRMEHTPEAALVNDTIAPVRVSLSDLASELFEDEMVEISSDCGDLQGTCKIKTIKGIAEFKDLSFNAAAPQVTLTVKAPGYEPVSSNNFPVNERKAISIAQFVQESEDKPVVIPYITSHSKTFVYCFANGKSLAVSDGTEIRIYNQNGKKICQFQQFGQIKCSATRNDILVLADWKGNLYVLRDNGLVFTISLILDEITFSIPGDVFLTDTYAQVGMWNGDFIRVNLSSDGKKEALFRHNAGIQKFVNIGENICVCDFDGNLVLYSNGRPNSTYPIEKSVTGMYLFDNCLIIIGEKKPYQFLFREGKMLSSQHEAPSSYSMKVNNHILSINEDGKGVFRDNELFVRQTFHVNSGAIPWCAGRFQEESFCSFVYPDNRYALLKNDKVIFTNISGILAFNVEMNMIVVGMRDGIIIQNQTWIQKLSREVLS